MASHQSDWERHASRLHYPAAISWLALGTDSSQPEPVSKLHSTLSPLTLHTPPDWPVSQIPASDWLTRPELLSQDTHTRHNQVLSPPVAKDTQALNFPQKVSKPLWNSGTVERIKHYHSVHYSLSHIYIWHFCRIQFKPLDLTVCIMREVISPETREWVSMSGEMSNNNSPMAPPPHGRRSALASDWSTDSNAGLWFAVWDSSPSLGTAV